MVVNRSLLIIILVVLAAISAVSIFLAYMSLQSTQSRLDLAATQELRREMSELTADSSADIEINLDIISRRLQTTATSTVLSTGAGSGEVRALLDATRVGMEQYSQSISYLDREGTLLYTTEAELLDQVGSDSSDLPYYTQARDRRVPVLTELFLAADGQPNISVAAPVPAPDGSFNGVLAATIHTGSIVDRIVERLPMGQDSHVFLVATDGEIIGSEGGVAAGNDIFAGFEARNEVAGRNLQLMTEGGAGVFEYTAQDGIKSVVAYSPVTFSGIHEWSVLTTTPALQSETFATVLSDQRVFTVAAIVLIVIIAAIFMAFILTLNSRLHRTVQMQDMQITSQLNDLQNAYERLTEQDRIKDEFINIAAHELRTPVLPIILSAEELAEDLGTDNSRVEIILRNAKRITKLTNDILDVSRIKSNTFRLQKDRVNVKKLIDEAVQDVIFKMAESKNPDLKISFESRLPEGKEEIVADSGRLNQVLANLLNNAVNFTDKGVIAITLQQSKDFGFIEVAVADTGSGIDPSVRPRLFEKFVTKSEKARGTGLGLYLCRAIVEAHGGRIWAEDNAGSGTVFAFTLPA